MVNGDMIVLNMVSLAILRLIMYKIKRVYF